MDRIRPSVLAGLAVLFFAAVDSAYGQSDFLCPPNNKMGLCEAVPSPCFSDGDCYNDEICCPEACARTCKPKMSPGQSAQAMAEAPDLLNDPRVYVGKCADSSCFSLFNSEPDQCSTSNLCRPEQFCCHDGCKNVCKWKPPYAAIIAKHEARVRYQQQLIYQKQQAELRKRQEEEFRQRQRKLAEMEQARRAAKARAEAEAVLAAQKAKAQYQAQMEAAKAAQAEAVSKMQQQMAQQQAAALLQQQQQQQQMSSASSPSSPSGQTAGNVASSSPNTATGTGGAPSGGNINLNGFFGALKNDKLSGTLANQINSPANFNPYTAAQMNRLDKSGGNYAPASAANNKISTGSGVTAVSSALAKLIMPLQNQYNTPAVNMGPPRGNVATPTFNNQAWSSSQASQPLRTYSYQSTSPAYSNNNNNVYSQQQQQMQQQMQMQQRQQQQQQQQQQPVSPYLMYHFMQTA